MPTLLDLTYHVIVLALVVVLGWNMCQLRDLRKQWMSAIVIIPLVLRLLNLK
ncbi:MAG: hypothetical protein NTY02_02035 [Acidobacteria bacterium]|nr:hypothetical protein [Acidobacteriota bacterium]